MLLITLVLLVVVSACGGEREEDILYAGKNAEAWLQVARDRSPETREEAAEALIALAPDSPRVVPGLVELLDHERRGIATSAAACLARIGAPAVPALSERLTDEKASRLVLGTLVRIGAPSVATLKERLTNGDLPAQRTAARALGSIGPAAADAVPHLARLVASEDVTLAASAVGALARIAPGAPAAVRAVAARRVAARPSTAAMDAAAATVLSMGAASGVALDEELALRCCNADAQELRVLGLATIMCADPIAVLRAVRDGTVVARPDVVARLDSIEGHEAALAETLRGVVSSSAPDASRRVAVRSLLGMGERAVPILQALWRARATRRIVRSAILAQKGALPFLYALRAEGDEETRAFASARIVDAVGPRDRTARARAVPALLDVAAHGDETHVARARRSLARWAKDRPDAKVIAALAAGLKHADAAVRASAAVCLAATGVPVRESVGDFVLLLRASDVTTQIAAVTCLERCGPAAAPATLALAAALRSRDVRLRAAAAAALGAIGRPAGAAAAALTSLLKDSHGHVRHAALRALLRIDEWPREAAGSIIPMIEELGPVVRRDALKALPRAAAGRVELLPRLREVAGSYRLLRSDRDKVERVIRRLEADRALRAEPAVEAAAAPRQSTPEVVAMHLKAGGILHGVIVAENATSVTIRVSSGSRLTFGRQLIDRIIPQK